MGSVTKIILNGLLLSVHLYASVLVAGGAGPFSLYNDFWSCQCSDLYEDPDLAISQALQPALLGGGLKQDSKDDGDEICRTLTTKEATSLAEDSRLSSNQKGGNGDVCKRKLPLRYLDLLLNNILAPMAAYDVRFYEPGSFTSELLIFSDRGLIPGFPDSVLRPPTV